MHKNYRKDNTSDIDEYRINSYIAGKKPNKLISTGASSNI